MVQPLIIGVSGKKRHGKDTVGAILSTKRGFRRTAFADPLKLTAMDLFGLTYEQCFGPGEVREAIDERWGLSARAILQLLGTEVGRSIHPDVWVRKTFQLIDEANAGEKVLLHFLEEGRFANAALVPGSALKWTVTDCRYPNEAAAVRARGGKIIKVVRPSLGESGDLHTSETHVDLVEEDFLITNDGTIAELEAKVLALPLTL